ncbi:MAG: phosphoglucosamine mutase, partial [Proteobacteria bacterium]|nr:phosphoglucosamine mutase [Pseudomonadota bacterium]
MAGIFGTDGVRARINTGPMRAEAVVRLALAAGRWFADNNQQEGRSTNPVVVIGKDTRLSGYMLESALVAGFTSIGINCRLLGPVPTAAVSYLTHSMRADFGVMISASHNPHQDNGIKLFGPDGAKLADKIELEISELMQGSIALAEPDKLGRARRIINSAQRYMEAAKATFDTSLSLGGLHLVVDCAHGAAYRTAPETLVELGADILPMGVAPDGLNINLECGATAPEGMARAVREAGADIGICLDGDADRLILADEKGRICDGDQILAALAIEMKENGRLKGPVIGTVMSNLGLERFLADAGIDFQRAAVGDRYIAAQMRETGSQLGGEPSGHILLPELTRTGDGLIAALQVLAILARSGKKACHPDIKAEMQAVADELGDEGR